MASKQRLRTTAVALVATLGCAGGGLVATAQPAESGSAAPAVTVLRVPAASAPSLLNPRKAVANVGRMPRGFAFSRRLTRDQEMNATRLCDGQSSNYSALSRRSASRFGYEASETYESGSFEGALVMRDVASAKRFMAQARAASLRCVNRPSAGSDHRVVSARIAVPGKWEESLGVATERRTPAGKPTNESYGSVAMLARKGRSIVAVKGWMMYAKPVAHRSEIRGFALPPRLAKVLGTLPR